MGELPTTELLLFVTFVCKENPRLRSKVHEPHDRPEQGVAVSIRLLY